MSKENVQKVEESVNAPAPEAVDAPVNIEIVDVVNAARIVEIAIERSAFKPNELIEIIPIYSRLQAFAKSVMEQQAATKEQIEKDGE